MALNSVTNYLSVLLLLIFVVNNFETTFVSVGVHHGHKRFGINSDECGLKIRPMIRSDIKFRGKCFRKSYQKFTYTDFGHKNRKSPLSRILKGIQAEPHESPWVVRILDRARGAQETICTGVLITLEWVLTSAHCVTEDPSQAIIDPNRKGYEILAGPKDMRKFYQNITSKWMTSHHRYWNRKDPERSAFDIGLIKLKSKMMIKHDEKERYYLNTICLPKVSEEMNDEREWATFFGWGHKAVTLNLRWFGAYGDQMPDILLKADFDLEPFNECDNVTLCAKFGEHYQGPKPCKGDSGGPLVQYIDDSKSVIRSVVIGILHGHDGAGGPCIPERSKSAKWVPVSKRIHWILETIRNNQN